MILTWAERDIEGKEDNNDSDEDTHTHTDRTRILIEREKKREIEVMRKFEVAIEDKLRKIYKLKDIQRQW